MNKFIIHLLTFTSLICNAIFGQDDLNNVKIGSRLQISSEFLKEKREIQVYLPPTYYFSNKNNYPVVYLYHFLFDIAVIICIL